MQYIKVIRATVAGGKRVEKDSILEVGKDLSAADAVRLVKMSKAIETKKKKAKDERN